MIKISCEVYTTSKEQVECPIWYARLNINLKKHVKELIGDSPRQTCDLEELLIDELGTDRRDIQSLLMWWFKMKKEAVGF